MPDVSVKHRQGDFVLETEFSLEAPWTVIFGPSGAGKSTLLRILAGLLTPETGHIELSGRTVLDTAKQIVLPPGRRSIGFVTQQAGLFPHLTVQENVAFGIRHLRREDRVRRVAEVLQMFGAADFADRKVPQLSGGERQRVALARALAPNPQLLLLDEPLAALDDASAQDILSRLLALTTRFVYVSHDLVEIWQIPGHAVLLHKGRIVASGLVQQALAAHRDRVLEQLGG